MASQPILQAKMRYLKFDVGEERLLELVGQGKTLDEIAEIVDPAGLEGIERTAISKFLGGLAWDQTSSTPDNEVEVGERRRRYKAARRLFAEAWVERAARDLRDESSDRRANLRKSQAEFAMRLAGVHHEDYKPPTAQVNVGVAIDVGQLHLDALRQRRVEVQVVEPEVLPPDSPGVEAVLLPAPIDRTDQ